MKLFEEQIARKPDHYPWTQDFIDAMWEGHWTPNEFDFKRDIHDFKTRLTEKEREVIIRTLSAIGQIEIAVKKFWARLGDNLPHPSITDMGLEMAHIEVIHNKAYEKLLTVLDLEENFENNLKVDVIEGRVKYLRKYLDKQYKEDRKQYIYSLILFTLFVENISLFSQFYIIFWFGRYKNCLKDTNQQVAYTKNEELIHAQVGIKIINILRQQYPEYFDQDLQDRVIHEANESFISESNIIDWIVGDYEGPRFNQKVLKEFVKSRINSSLESIGFPKLYDIDAGLYRDFEWMNEEIHGNSMKDFFDTRPVDYSKKNKSFSEEEVF